MSAPTFSIVVPIYNIEKYLDKCVQSILNQTYKDFELILVNDGSKDNSPAMCDSYAKNDSRIKVIHKQNAGPSGARRTAAEIATGQYIACVDGDDWISEVYLEKFAEIINSFRPSIICCNFYSGTEGSVIQNQYYTKNKLYDRHDIENELFPNLLYAETGKSISSTLWAKVFERNLYTKIQSTVPDSISVGEDIAVIKPCVAIADSIYTMEDALYFYRYNPASITKGRKPFAWDGPLLRGRHLEQQLDLSVLDLEQQLNRAVCHALFNVAMSQFYKKENFFSISKEIKNQLSSEYYAKKINACNFRSPAKKFMLFSLKHKVTFLMYLYNKLKP